MHTTYWRLSRARGAGQSSSGRLVKEEGYTHVNNIFLSLESASLGEYIALVVLMFLFETLGGWSEPVVRLFRRMKDKVRNKLTKRQYEHEVSWSTSTWLALQAQRLSVALHIASAWEIATEMQLAGGGGEAPATA